MTQNDVDVDALWEKHSTHGKEDKIEDEIMYKEDFTKAITASLAGRWAKDDINGKETNEKD